MPEEAGQTLYILFQHLYLTERTIEAAEKISFISQKIEHYKLCEKYVPLWI